jgi:hypothetical protein
MIIASYFVQYFFHISTISPTPGKSIECDLSATVLERVTTAKLSVATYKYAPAGKTESVPGRSGPSVELLATVNCLLRGFDALPVRDRWHLVMHNEFPVIVISHPETFNVLPETVISHQETFNGLPIVVI